MSAKQQQLLNFKVKRGGLVETDHKHEQKRTVTEDNGQQKTPHEVVVIEEDEEKGEERRTPLGTPRKRPLCITPTKSPSTLTKFKSLEFQSPVKESPSKHIRRALCYEHLATPISPPSKVRRAVRDLPLPYQYQLLEEKYHNTNIVLSMLEGRKEICTFKKLQKSIQEIMRKSFQLKDLAQMKYLCPDSLLLRQDRHIPGTINKQEYNSYQLVIQSNVKTWNPSVHLERRKEIHEKLLQETIKHHKVFLDSLSITVPDKELYRWHINFELQNVPHVPEGDLPRPPINESYNSASDLLQQTEKVLSSRVQTALERVQKKESNEDAPLPASTPLLKGVSPAIIDRIRKKEAAKAALDMSRDPQTEEKLTILSRLPEMSRIIRSLFVTEGKAAILWSHLIQKIMDSHTSSLSIEQIDSHLQLLLETIPEWCIVVHVKGNKYMKLKNKSLSHQTINKLIHIKETELNSTN